MECDIRNKYKICGLPYLFIMKFNILYLSIINLYSSTPVIASTVLRPRGVSLSMSSFYDSSKAFTCFDGSGTMSFNHVNDDFCDCNDGSDEPGTAACPNGYFHCTNIGHIGKDIYSSFVNDGVCDCCDTSDEYASEAECLDSCHALGEVARAEARHKAEVQLEGFSLRQKMAEEGVKIKKDKQIRIEELSKEKEKVEVEQAEKLSIKDTAEIPEKEALEQYKALEEEIKARKERERRAVDENDARNVFAKLDEDNNGLLTISELQSKNTFDTNRDGEVSEDEAKFYLQQKEEVDLDTFLTSIWALMKPTYMHHKRLFTPPETEHVDQELSLDDNQNDDDNRPSESGKEYETDFETREEELEEEEEEEEEEESEDYADEAEDAEISKEKENAEIEEDEIQYDPETQRLIDIASAARDEFKAVDDHLRDIIKEIQNLEEDLKKDFGPDEEFRGFDGRCYEYTDREYTYKLCPFDSVVQKPKNGHGETRLGSWGIWAGPTQSPYSVMKYTGGQGCWNGPQRSAEVQMFCGLVNELTSVTEPNRCEYLFLFTTPAICTQPENGDNVHQHTEL